MGARIPQQSGRAAGVLDRRERVAAARQRFTGVPAVCFHLTHQILGRGERRFLAQPGNERDVDIRAVEIPEKSNKKISKSTTPVSNIGRRPKLATPS